MGASHSHETTANLRLAFVLNTGFAILEIFGGIWTNSVAILSDAVHDLGDSLALGAAWSSTGTRRRDATDDSRTATCASLCSEPGPTRQCWSWDQSWS